MADPGNIIDATEAPKDTSFVVNPSGDVVAVPSGEVTGRLSAGYTPASEEQKKSFLQKDALVKKYGSVGQQIATGAEAAASTATFGLSDLATQAFGITTPGAQKAREEVNPLASQIGTGVGIAGPAFGGDIFGLLGGASEGASALKTAGQFTAPGLISKAGQAVEHGVAHILPGGAGDVIRARQAAEIATSQAEALSKTAADAVAANAPNAGELATQAQEARTAAKTASDAAKTTASPLSRFIARVAPQAVGSAVEGAAYGSQQAVHEKMLGDPREMGELLMANVGPMAIMGGALGGALGVTTSAASEAALAARKGLGETTDWLWRTYPKAAAALTGASEEDVAKMLANRHRLLSGTSAADILGESVPVPTEPAPFVKPPAEPPFQRNVFQFDRSAVEPPTPPEEVPHSDDMGQIAVELNDRLNGMRDLIRPLRGEGASFRTAETNDLLRGVPHNPTVEIPLGSLNGFESPALTKKEADIITRHHLSSAEPAGEVPVSLVDRVVSELPNYDDKGLSSIPPLVEALAKEGKTVPEIHEALLDAHRAGRIELRPGGAIGGLTKQELAFAPAGPQGTRLTWARNLEDTSTPEMKAMSRLKAVLPDMGFPVGKEPELLGSGAQGSAFDIGDGRVVKITNDKTEAKAAEKIRQDAASGAPSKHLYRVDSVLRLPDSAMGKPSYAIVQEKLNQLPESTDAGALSDAMVAVRDAKISLGETGEQIPTWAQTEAQIAKQDPKDAARLIGLAKRFDLDKIVDELHAKGISFEDWHNGNILMRDDGSHVLIDPGHSGGGISPARRIASWRPSPVAPEELPKVGHMKLAALPDGSVRMLGGHMDLSRARSLGRESIQAELVGAAPEGGWSKILRQPVADTPVSEVNRLANLIEHGGLSRDGKQIVGAKEMESSPFQYAPAIRENLRKIRLDLLGNASEAKDAADVFNTITDAKKELKPLTNFGHADSIADNKAKKVAGALYHELRTALEREDVWGHAAARTQAVNEAIRESGDTEKTLAQTIMGKKEFESGHVDRPFDAERLRKELLKLGDPTHAAWEQKLIRFREAQAKLVDEVEKSARAAEDASISFDPELARTTISQADRAAQQAAVNRLTMDEAEETVGRNKAAEVARRRYLSDLGKKDVERRAEEKGAFDLSEKDRKRAFDLDKIARNAQIDAQKAAAKGEMKAYKDAVTTRSAALNERAKLLEGTHANEAVGLWTGLALMHHPLLAPAWMGARMMASPLRTVKTLASMEAIGQTMREKLGGATKAFVNGSARLADVGRQEVLAGVAKSHGRDYEDARKRFEKQSQEISTLASDPQVMFDRLQKNVGSVTGAHAPQITTAIGASMGQAVQYLNAHLPRSPEGAPMGSEWQPDRDQLATWNTIADAIANPISLLKQAGNGTLEPEAVDAVKTVYPLLYQQMQRQLYEELSASKKATYQTKLQAALLMGVDLTGTTDAASTAWNQSTFAPQPPVQQGNGPAPRKPRGTSAKHVTLAERSMTATQDVTARAR